MKGNTMALGDLLKTINAALEEELGSADFSDPQTVYEQITSLLTEYVNIAKETDDTYYAKRCAVWLVEVANSHGRKDKTITEFPEAAGRIYDRAYEAICSVVTTEEGVKLTLDSFDRELVSVIELPKTDISALLKEVKEADSAKKESSGNSGLIVVTGD